MKIICLNDKYKPQDRVSRGKVKCFDQSGNKVFDNSNMIVSTGRSAIRKQCFDYILFAFMTSLVASRHSPQRGKQEKLEGFACLGIFTLLNNSRLILYCSLKPHISLSIFFYKIKVEKTTILAFPFGESGFYEQSE